MSTLSIQIAQANFTVGAIDNNLRKIIDIYQQITSTSSPDIIVFSELAITGYPAEDLYLQKDFQLKSIKATEKLQEITKNNSSAIIIGNLAYSGKEKPFNAAYFISNGEVIHIENKKILPNYGVFDEHRYFTPGNKTKVINWKDHKIALLICEDMWQEDVPDQLYQQDVDLIISIHASPFTIEKDKNRKTIAKDLCLTHKLDLVYANQVGGQDELVFDGGSFICNKKGEITSQLDYFKEDWTNKYSPIPPKTTAIYQALMLGLSDYTSKNGFDKVLLGLSGGIDSALTAAIAVDALGANKVVAVMLPSQYTSELSIIDAKNLAKELNIELLDIPIEESTKAIKASLSHIAKLEPGSLTDQNIQARMRGIMLMSLSNQFGYLLLSTGNKSENAVGYATLYGDMCGGFNVLKDLYKTQVYELSKYRALPKSIIEKAPSAELHHNQKDQDILPDYDLLDKILFSLIEENLSLEEIEYDKEIVIKIYNLLKKSEYKRRQSCPGVIISTRALTNDWRYPITNGL